MSLRRCGNLGGGGTGRVATERTGNVTTGSGDRRCDNWGTGTY